VRHLRLGPVEVDLAARRVRRPGAPDARLTPIEHKLLLRLLSADGAAVSQEDLLRDVWGYRSLQTRTLATTMRRLRGKVEVDPASPAVLLTVPNLGYRLERSQEAPRAAPSLPGREDELARTEAALRAGRMVTVVGPPGADPAAVARALVTATGGVHVRWRGSGWAALARAMGWPVATPDEATVTELTHRSGIGLVWLEREGADPCDAAFVESLLAASPSLRVLVTSDRPLRAPGEEVVRCDGLPPSAARALLGPGDPDTLGAIAAAVDHLPAALALVRPWLEWLGPEEVLRLLQSGSTLDRDDAPGLRQLVDGAIGSLPEPARSVTRALAAFSGPASLADLAAVCPGSEVGLAALVDRRLAARTGSGRFVLLALVRRHVRAHEPADFDDVFVRHLAGFGDDDALVRVSAVGDPDAVRRAVAARADLQLAHGRASSMGRSETAARLALAAAATTPWAGDVDAAAALLERTLPSLPESPLRARVAATWAELERAAGRSRRAELALPSSTPDEDPELTLGRASVWCGLGRLEEADEAVTAALTRATEVSDLRGRLLTLAYRIATVLGRHDAGWSRLRGALNVHEALGHTRRVALLLSRLAVEEARHGRAWTSPLRDARRAAEAVDDTEGLAAAAAAEGFLRALASDPARARECYLEAADRYRELGRTEEMVRMELDAAGAAVNLGALDEAWDAVSPRLADVRRRGDRQAEARALFLLGEIRFRLGDVAGARAYLEPAEAAAVFSGLREDIQARLASLR
jgi:DNA-binding winged helix-turn-helix (wHTH) protein/tetratricopeptide (TPR) repeat protein